VREERTFLKVVDGTFNIHSAGTGDSDV
jgi:hypothetical protein